MLLSSCRAATTVRQNSACPRVTRLVRRRVGFGSSSTALARRPKRIAQKQMIAAAFEADQFSPQRLLRREIFSSDQAGTVGRSITARDLRRQREEQFVQTLFGEEVTDQMWPAFRENHVTVTYAADHLED